MHRMKASLLLALLLAGCAVSTSPAEQGAPAAQADTLPELQAFGQACRAHPDDANACTAGLYCLGETEYGPGSHVCTFECAKGGVDARCDALGAKCVHAWDTCDRPDPSIDCVPPTLVQHSLCVVP